jgi:hypothetical protein
VADQQADRVGGVVRCATGGVNELHRLDDLGDPDTMVRALVEPIAARDGGLGVAPTRAGLRPLNE